MSKLRWHRENRTQMASIGLPSQRDRVVGFILPIGHASPFIVFSDSNHADAFGRTLSLLRDLSNGEHYPNLEQVAGQILQDLGERPNES